MDYLGEELKLLTQRRVDNFKKIVDSAQKKLRDREVKQVPPRVMKALVREATFYDDPLSAEYFGGVLASSVSGVSRDDRGVVVLDAISRLSTYQLRSHYIFYRILRDLYVGKDLLNPLVPEDRMRLVAYMEFSAYARTMALDHDELHNLSAILTNVLPGLARQSLIQERYAAGTPGELRQIWSAPHASLPAPGFMYLPTPFGFDLFLWAHGREEI